MYVERLIRAKRFFCSAEVWEEVKAKDAVAKAWMSKYLEVDGFLVPTDNSITARVRKILKDHARLVMQQQKGRNRADPFVIAVASTRGATVLTGEAANGSARVPKIPFVCGSLNPAIPCIRFVDMIRQEGWTFS